MGRAGVREAVVALIMTVAATTPATAQRARLNREDSAVVQRILMAEDRRDHASPALNQGMRHRDARVRALAARARGRIADPAFALRDSLPLPRPPVHWPEPPWRLRYRALATQRNDCGALRAALADSVWPVRLRAADLLGEPCAADDSAAAVLRRWVDALPAQTSRRAAGEVSWHAAAHALVALARMRAEEARPRLARLAEHAQWQVRLYSARAAGVLADLATLRRLARDADDNVKEVAIESLSKITGHADDEVYLAALRADGAQAVRAAAVALKGSPRGAEVRAAANAAFERFVARANQSERDVRHALLEAAGRPVTDDRAPPAAVPLPRTAVDLALGADIGLRITLDAASGGGWFVVRLRGDVAPIMAARVLALAQQGYYNGLDWHRVEPDFVIQGLGPGSNEYIGYQQYFRDELGRLEHKRGTVGMSTRGHDTGDAQWFINLKDNLRLTRDYTVFAEVVEGIEVVDGILEGDRVARIRRVR